MYICNDVVCDPLCNFCWYCIHDKNGVPFMCVKNKFDFNDGSDYCEDFRCRLHETKHNDIISNE